MKRLEITETISALAALEDIDVPARVDALVDVCLVGLEPTRAARMRRELAQEYLSAAPLTELTYRIWQRIARDDEDSYGQAYIELRRPSQRFLPSVDFDAALCERSTGTIFGARRQAAGRDDTRIDGVLQRVVE